MGFQLCLRDEYGQNSILVSSTDDINALITRAKAELLDRNEANALTVDYKNANWEAFMPVFFVEDEDGNEVETDEVFYGGTDTKGKEIAYYLQEDGTYGHTLLEDVGVPYKLYLGVLDMKDWYAMDEKKKVLTDIVHRTTEAKDIYFLRNPNDRL